MTSNVLKQGGGSGGGDDGNNTIQTADGVYEIAANQLVFLTRPPKDGDPGPHVITILAAGNTLTDGKVDMRGSKGVRITAGPPPITNLGPPVTADSTDGVEIMVGGIQNVTIQRGSTDFAQTIEMTPQGIMVQCGTLPTSPSIEMTLDSMTLSIGTSTSIAMGADGITLLTGDGMSILQLNADGTVMISGMVVQISGESMVGINS
jgi:hypothetical protein